MCTANDGVDSVVSDIVFRLIGVNTTADCQITWVAECIAELTTTIDPNVLCVSVDTPIDLEGMFVWESVQARTDGVVFADKSIKLGVFCSK